jgi:hypothetical protein
MFVEYGAYKRRFLLQLSYNPLCTRLHYNFR